MIKSVKTTAQLWADYLFLTREMAKFLDKSDMDMFFTLMDQREELQAIIDAQADPTYVQTPAGCKIIEQIQLENHTIQIKLERAKNQLLRQQRLERAYDGYGAATGRRMDIKE